MLALNGITNAGWSCPRPQGSFILIKCCGSPLEVNTDLRRNVLAQQKFTDLFQEVSRQHVRQSPSSSWCGPCVAPSLVVRVPVCASCSGVDRVRGFVCVSPHMVSLRYRVCGCACGRMVVPCGRHASPCVLCSAPLGGTWVHEWLFGSGWRWSQSTFLKVTSPFSAFLSCTRSRKWLPSTYTEKCSSFAVTWGVVSLWLHIPDGARRQSSPPPLYAHVIRGAWI